MKRCNIILYRFRNIPAIPLLFVLFCIPFSPKDTFMMGGSSPFSIVSSLMAVISMLHNVCIVCDVWFNLCKFPVVISSFSVGLCNGNCELKAEKRSLFCFLMIFLGSAWKVYGYRIIRKMCSYAKYYGINLMLNNMKNKGTLSSWSLKREFFRRRMMSFSVIQLNIKSHPWGPWTMSSENPSVFFHTEYKFRMLQNQIPNTMTSITISQRP